MAKSTLRNESTQAGKEIWAAVDKAASRAPDWVKGKVVEASKRNITRASKKGGSTKEVATITRISKKGASATKGGTSRTSKKGGSKRRN